MSNIRTIQLRASLSNMTDTELGRFFKEYYARLDDETLGRHLRESLLASSEEQLEQYHETFGNLNRAIQEQKQILDAIRDEGPCRDN